jgi:general secretion pathway protein J
MVETRTQNLRCAQRGFTLLELLLSVAILMLIVGIVGGAFRLSIRSWEKGEEEVEEFRKTRIVLDKLAQQIKSFYPYWLKQEETWALAFEGQSQTLTFVSPVSLLSPFITGLVCVQYAFGYGETAEGGQSLIVRELRIVDGESLAGSLTGGALQGGSEVTLLTDLEEVTFDYYVVPEDAEEGQWLQSWVMEEKDDAEEIELPQAIRITLKQKPGSKNENQEEEEEAVEPLVTAMTIPLVTAPYQDVSAISQQLAKSSSASGSSPSGLKSSLPLPPAPGSPGEKSPFGFTLGPPRPGGEASVSDNPFAPAPGGTGGSGAASNPFER